MSYGIRGTPVDWRTVYSNYEGRELRVASRDRHCLQGCFFWRSSRRPVDMSPCVWSIVLFKTNPDYIFVLNCFYCLKQLCLKHGTGTGWFSRRSIRAQCVWRRRRWEWKMMLYALKWQRNETALHSEDASIAIHVGFAGQWERWKMHHHRQTCS